MLVNPTRSTATCVIRKKEIIISKQPIRSTTCVNETTRSPSFLPVLNEYGGGDGNNIWGQVRGWKSYTYPVAFLIEMITDNGSLTCVYYSITYLIYMCISFFSLTILDHINGTIFFVRSWP